MKMTNRAIRCSACAVAIVATIQLAGCASRASESTPSYPSGIDFHSGRNRLFVSGYGDGAVRTLDPDRGSYERLLEERKDGRQRALRVRVDVGRERLWVLDWGVVYAYDIPTRRLVRRVELSGAILAQIHYTCLPDLALDRSGAAFVSSNAEPVLWRIDPASFELRRYDIVPEEDRNNDFGFTGLAFAGEEGVLFGASAVMGSLWRIELGSAKARKVALSSPIRGACGLAAAHADGGRTRAPVLYVSGGFANGLQRIAMSSDLSRGNVARVSAGDSAAVPTSLVFAKDILFLAGSQLSRHPDFGRDGGLDVTFGTVAVNPPRE